MNEKIKEIAQKAGLESFDFPYDEFGMPFELEKFAELIIAEATECVRDVLRDEKSELTYGAATQVQERIKENFGIKELKDSKT